ncbi:hypothetical protein LAZ67_19001894 [Cordylochernes scorpioides]|uniref:HAT C-terminal dimerisation domain-containing protein n=1 Tax=Cordylochernes scorpioides TaxID=51811 RepID=A0ABY6LJ11_9ARAC|nr:hypothetical protein LAZ67_19001894 [Cordylochernes scorpioides]
MSDVLKPVISTVNFIRSFELNHRQFRQFIAEIGDTDLPYHTAERWLSCGKVLQRFFELRAVIEIFLNEKHRPLTELQNNAWLWKLAFYVDLTKHVNELNLRLQGENQHLPDLYTNIKSFRMKLILFQSQLRSKCFSLFKTCEIFSHTTETEFPIDFAIETLSALKINFDTRFSDFDAIANQIKIFQNPFDADIETLAPELQMEMIDLQCSDIIKNKYENSSLLEFYKSLPLTQIDNLHKFARGLFSVFGTTYLCEKTFSKMKYTKNVYRSKLTDEHLKSLLIIGLTLGYHSYSESRQDISSQIDDRMTTTKYDHNEEGEDFEPNENEVDPNCELSTSKETPRSTDSGPRRTRSSRPIRTPSRYSDYVLDT